MIKNPYKVLGVPDGADMDTVTAAYKKLAKKYHPDLNPNDASAAEKMAEIKSAYDQIKNGETKSDYGFYGQKTSSSASANDYMRSVQSFLMSGQYAQALNLLKNIEDRNAKWHYFAAVAYSGLQNKEEAIKNAKRACELEPSNTVYQRAYQSLINGENPSDDYDSPFGSFTFGGFGFPFGSYTYTTSEQNGRRTTRRRGGCLSLFLKIFLIILIIRLIVGIFFGGLFGIGRSRRPSYYSQGNSQYSQYGDYDDDDDDTAEFFGSKNADENYRG